MPWILAGLAGVGFIELFMRLPILPTIADIKTLVTNVRFVVASARISDHWKEKVLLAYARRLLALTMKLAVCLVVAFTPFILIAGVSVVFGVPFVAFTLSLAGALFVTIFAIAYAKLRFGYAVR